MASETLISPEALRGLLDGGADVLIVDCEFDLADTAKGRAIYAQGHIPGARHAHLENDLSGPSSGTNGRHPLPDRETFAATMRAMGLRQGQQVVSYDGGGNAGAARLWWLLRWAGHRAVAVLDGGRQAWVAAGLALEAGEPGPRVPGDFLATASLVPEPVSAADVLANIASGERKVIDARDPARYRGDPNPMDPVSGHIPGACNRFFRDNLDGEGQFRSPEELARAFTAVLADVPAERVILQCGSGVTACHNALAMAVAGMDGARLYPGSWSEWIADPARPIAKD